MVAPKGDGARPDGAGIADADAKSGAIMVGDRWSVLAIKVRSLAAAGAANGGGADGSGADTPCCFICSIN
jgi:hypothetical protein